MHQPLTPGPPSRTRPATSTVTFTLNGQTIVAPAETIQAIEIDPTDDRILECAVAAGAEVIVSGDAHLLTLGIFRGIRIQRVAEFLRDFPEQRRSSREGIVQRSAVSRFICHASAWLGIELDDEANDQRGPRISKPGCAVSAWVIPTNEELMIARHTLALLPKRGARDPLPAPGT